MMISRSQRHTEAGHAVALTLLGLAVAILAGVAVLYIIGKERSAPIPLTEPVAQETVFGEEETDPRAGWKRYENRAYQFAFEYPDGWAVATSTILGVPVVTVFDARQTLEASSTFGVHDADIRMSVYPHGTPLEEFGEKEVDSTVIVPVAEASSKDLVLGTSKRPWATITHFDRFPETWTNAGFVLARAHITEETVTYLRDGQEVPFEEYDVYAGDTAVRHGFVDPTVRAVQEEMMRSFQFVSNMQGAVQERAQFDVADMIRVLEPQPDARVMSPLTIAGEARGTWFFEGDFPVRLVDASSTVLAEVPATAQDDWMTEEFVSFEVSLVFASTTATSGTLVLSRANPAGPGPGPGDAELVIPVRFVQ